MNLQRRVLAELYHGASLPDLSTRQHRMLRLANFALVALPHGLQASPLDLVRWI